MNIKQSKTRKLVLPDFDLMHVFETMLVERVRLLEDIDYLISEIANNIPDEIVRIQKAAEWYHYRLWSEARSKGTELEFEVKKPTDREPSDAEIELSLCIHFSNSMLDEAANAEKISSVWLFIKYNLMPSMRGNIPRRIMRLRHNDNTIRITFQAKLSNPS